MRHRPPPLRHWRFKDEKYSPWEAHIRSVYTSWANCTDKVLKAEKKWTLKRVEKIAKAYDIDLSDIKIKKPRFLGLGFNKE